MSTAYDEHRGTCTAIHPKATHRQWFEHRLASSWADGFEKGSTAMSERLHRAIDMHHVEMCNCGNPAEGPHTAGEAADHLLWSHYRGDLAYPPCLVCGDETEGLDVHGVCFECVGAEVK